MDQPIRRWSRRLGPVICALVVALVSGRASAAEGGWGDQGRIVLTGALAAENVSAGGSSATEVAFTPGIRYFAMNHLAIGADLQLVHVSSGSGITAVGLLPSIGYDVVLSEVVSIVPQLELMLQIQSAGSSTLTRFAVGGFMPVIVHPPGHFFVGFGPEVLADVSSNLSGGISIFAAQKQTLIGARSVIGAWF